MKVEVVMPKMGESINEGTLIKWHKKKGDSVKKDEIIFEISTDKVDTEIPAPETGIISEIKVFEQETVDVDTVVAIIDTGGEESVQKEEEAKPKETPSTTQVGGEMIDITMPKMGESVMEGTIIKWHKQVGDKIKKDEIIFEISTDKVDTEVPSAEEGYLAEILVKEQETVEVGMAVARISTTAGLVKADAAASGAGLANSGNSGAASGAGSGSVNSASGSASSSAGGASGSMSDGAGGAGSRVAGGSNQGGTSGGGASSGFYSPLVMNIAKTEGIGYDELERISGTGLGGRVSKKDILEYVKNRSNKGTAEKQETYGGQSNARDSYTRTSNENGPNKDRTETQVHNNAGSKQPLQPQSKGAVEVIPMDNIRQRIMYHMKNSRDTSVHVTAVIEIDMTKVHNFVNKNKDKFLSSEGVKLTYMPFISYAVIKGLKEYPFLNASIDGNNILVKKNINLGIAVAVEPNGLIVPNIKNSDEKNVVGLAKAIAELGYKARNKKLVPDDIMDGTFSITNYGVFGSLFGTPIINQPEVGILGIGAVTKKPVVVEVDGMDTIAIKPMMYLSLSHDHRLVDGMLGGKFLKLIKDILENFETGIV
ncbi:MAG: 2-oxoglutarate dehydrogenase, E2 component, dihydrolipoamide succinyltransferase [Melioribacteraceae bacterium]|nr:2-oxoglutarate dehydrogenase, E2 component, dihydrolipoamide succinyltransferase [Melioribacteraceae bacterium]